MIKKKLMLTSTNNELCLSKKCNKTLEDNKYLTSNLKKKVYI